MKNYRRHKILMRFMTAVPARILARMFRYNFKRASGPDEPSIIIANHNADVDPALVALGFKRHMYFLASEHAFRKGLLTKFLEFVFDPISFNKVKPDTSSLKEMLNRVKAGSSVALFAEGNRSFNGLTGHIPVSTAKLVKMSGAALITFRIEGGYFTTPRWAKNRRQGKMTGAVVGRYSAAEIKNMTVEEVYAIIKQDINEDAYKRQKENPIPYRGKDLAEYIERILYLCPSCDKIGTIKSSGNRFFCSCGLDAVYTETCFLEGKNLPFTTITEWDLWQVKRLAEMVNSSGGKTIFSDHEQKLFVIEPNKTREFAGMGTMSISSTELCCAGEVFPLGEITGFAVVGKMTLTFALKSGKMYEAYSDAPYSAKKYIEALRILRNENSSG
jgi:1-acyl-sn-glycerol-3-phosphate acyltransferase